MAVDGGALLRIDARRLPLPADAPAQEPRFERTEVYEFEAGRADREALAPSPQFRGNLDDEPAQPMAVAPPSAPSAPRPTREGPARERYRAHHVG